MAVVGDAVTASHGRSEPGPGRQVARRPEPAHLTNLGQDDRFDDPQRLDAFLDTVRWGAITSADGRPLQASFRSGITIEDYHLGPVVRALQMPQSA